jgi:ceroid-lipofuscinosis MFS transporter 7
MHVISRSLVAMLLFLNILTKGGMSVHETLGTQVAVMLGSTAATVGTVAAVFGAFGVISLLSMAMLCKRFKDIQLIGWSLTALSGCAVIIALCTSGGSRRNKAALVFFMLSTLVVYSTAYPIGHTAVLGYFSKVSDVVHTSLNRSTSRKCLHACLLGSNRLT